MIQADLIVIGSGIAGLNFALKANDYAEVVIITKDALKNSNTLYAQGGLAAVFSPEDSFESHIEDTLKVGEGLSERKVVEFVVKNAPSEIINLERLGVKFDKANGHFLLSKEAAHSKPRIVHVADATGRNIEEILCRHVKHRANLSNTKKIMIFENCLAFEIILKDNICHGVYALDCERNKIFTFLAKAVLLATGGIGQLYKYTTNPSVATGDGIAMAYKAGARLADLEFIQFHPTMFAKKNFLISETVRGEGGILKNIRNERFMEGYSKDAELAPRNVVARACYQEMGSTPSDYVYLDISHRAPSYIRKRFPNIYQVCKENGIDMTKEPIPVLPAAHYLCGGVLTNLNAETNIKGLYAIGEVACTRLHGADRLASNSLTEALVFSSHAGNIVKNYIFTKKGFSGETIFASFKINPDRGHKIIQDLKSELQEVMWNKVGIIRSAQGLREALKNINLVQKKVKKSIAKGINKDLIELSNLATAAGLITKSALIRKESLGCHFILEKRNINNKQEGI